MKTWISSALNPKHRRLDALQARYDEALCDCTENLLVHLAQLEYCWCLYSAPLYTLQGHSLIPPHFPLISLAHTHTHMGHCEGHPAFPTFPLVPGISEDLPDPLFADPSNTYGPTFTTGWCFLQRVTIMWMGLVSLCPVHSFELAARKQKIL